MNRTAKRSPFKNSAEVDECQKMLSGWLNPASPNTKVIDGNTPTFKQLAVELSAHFRIRPPLSAETVRKYVNALKNDNKDLLTRKPGYRQWEKLQHESVPAKKPSVRKKSAEVTLLAEIAAEAVQLTGLSPSALHKTFSGQATWKKFFGQRSGFYYRLQKKLDAKHLAGDSSSIRPDQDFEHSLRLYQITLRTPKDTWCAVLLAYEPRTHFLNAACYVVSPTTSNKQGDRLTDSSDKQLDHLRRPILAKKNAQTSLHLPADLLSKFIFGTRELMAVPLDTVYLSTTLGNPIDLIQQLQEIAPKINFLAIPNAHFPFISQETGKLIKVRALCLLIEKLLNQHYQEAAFKKLDDYQSRLDELIKKDYLIHKMAFGRQQYKPRPYPYFQGNVFDSKEDLKKAKEMVIYRRAHNDRLHVKRRLHITPIDLICDAY